MPTKSAKPTKAPKAASTTRPPKAASTTKATKPASATGPGPRGQPKDARILKHRFLREMYEDDYFPNRLVDKGKAILLKLCAQIEKGQPRDADAVYALTHAATERFNDLAEEFMAQDSDIETAAREAIAADFAFILRVYGFGHLDIEEAIAPRDW